MKKRVFFSKEAGKVIIAEGAERAREMKKAEEEKAE